MRNKNLSSVALVLAIIVMVIGGYLHIQQAQGLSEKVESLRIEKETLERQGQTLGTSLKTSEAQVATLKAEVAALERPEHKEALRLLAAWPTICGRMPLANIVPTGVSGGDPACAGAIQGFGKNVTQFPGTKEILAVYHQKDPLTFLTLLRISTRDRCNLMRGTDPKPEVCAEVSLKEDGAG